MKVVVHMDVNGTAIPSDPSCGLSPAAVAGLSLCSLVCSRRHSSSSSSSSAPRLRFLRLFGGPSDAASAGGEVTQLYCELERAHSRKDFHRIAAEGRGGLEQFSHVRSRLLSAVAAGAADEKQHRFLESFWRLLDWLCARSAELEWCVAFRTFGPDLSWALPLVAERAQGRFPVELLPAKISRTEGGRVTTLRTPDGRVLDEVGAASWLESQKGVVGVEDDWYSWARQNGNAAHCAKPLWVRPSTDGSGVVHIFFDDNARPGDSNTAVDLRIFDTKLGSFVPAFSRGWQSEDAKEAAEVHIVPARLLEAATNKDYFVDQVRLRTEPGELFVRTATSDELLQCRRANSTEWGKGVPLEKYLQRETTLGHSAFAFSAEFSGWVLSDSPWHHRSSRVLCACETYRFESAFQGERGHCYGIASVFTVPELRGNGYAAKLITKLVAHLAKVDPLAQAVVLFSDIGTFYRRCGFECSSETPDTVVFPSDAASGKRLETTPQLLQLGTPELAQQWAVAREQIVSRVPQDSFVLIPTLEKLEWFALRDACIFPALENPCCGAAHGKGWAFWMPSRNDNVLDIHLACGDEADLSLIIAEARRYAARIGMKQVRMWRDTNLGDVEHARWFTENSGAIVQRTGSIPMLCPLRSGLNVSAAFLPHLFWV